MADEPDGLESLGFEPPKLQVKPRGRWWLAARGLVSSIVLASIWTVLFLLRVVELIIDGSIDWLGWILLALSGVLAIGYLPTVVHFARLRKHP
jgi:hypothetical protein